MVRLPWVSCLLGGLLFVVSVAQATEEKYINKTGAEIQKLYEELVEQGWTPIMIKGKASGNITRYDMIWDSDRIGAWYFWYGLEKQDFEDKKTQLRNQGLNQVQEDH